MMRALIAAAALTLAAHTASAQHTATPSKAQPKVPVHQAANSAKSAKAAAPSKAVVQQAAKSAAPAKPGGAPAKPAGPARGATPQAGTKLELPSDTTPSHVTLMREVFAYDPGGRRDPFLSLLNTSELRPGINDLRLTGILYDESGRHSIATLRDLGTNALYRVSVGTTLGRMHVAAIRIKTVVFSIDEFGTTRQDSLILGDTSKARPR